MSIKDLYWKIIPYDWRPGQIYYRFICWSWRRYSTVKPRYLGHTWVDMDHLLEHTMFEILSRFVEKEIDNANWDWNEEHRNAYKEIMSLYHWWHDGRNKQYAIDDDRAWEEIRKYSPEITWKPIDDLYVEMVSTWKNPGDEEKYHALLDVMNVVDAARENELEANLIRLIKIKNYLWT